MSIDFKEAELESGVMSALREAVYLGLLRIKPSLEVSVKQIIARHLTESPEGASLLGGDLRSQFGIKDSASAVAAILNAVVNSVGVSVERGTSKGQLGKLRVYALRADMGDVLGLAEASYTSLSVLRNTSIIVPWLRWLLLEGDQLVVTDFEVNSSKERPASRTGRAIMIQTTPRQSKGFKVPANFSGVVDNNWLTRVMSDSLPEVINAIGSSLRGL